MSTFHCSNIVTHRNIYRQIYVCIRLTKILQNLDMSQKDMGLIIIQRLSPIYKYMSQKECFIYFSIKLIGLFIDSMHSTQETSVVLYILTLFL